MEEKFDIVDSGSSPSNSQVGVDSVEGENKEPGTHQSEGASQDFTSTDEFDRGDNENTRRDTYTVQRESAMERTYWQGREGRNTGRNSDEGTVREKFEDENDRDDDDDDDDDGSSLLSSDSSCDTETNGEIVQLLPRVNCPEKIILCLDLSAEMKNTPFLSKDGTRYPSLQMVKRAVSIFVHSKAAINRKHEFALVVLQDNALWMHNFTSNTEEFCYVLADLDNESEYDSFDMSSLFEIISEKVMLPSVDGDDDVIPPPYIVRTIIIYGRSHCVPEFSHGRQVMQSLMQSPYFFLDAFYIHETPSEDNQCEVIFDRLCELDERGTSFVFEVSRNPTYLHDNMAKLVAHPLQRPLQKDISYKLLYEYS